MKTFRGIHLEVFSRNSERIRWSIFITAPRWSLPFISKLPELNVQLTCHLSDFPNRPHMKANRTRHAPLEGRWTCRSRTTPRRVTARVPRLFPVSPMAAYRPDRSRPSVPPPPPAPPCEVGWRAMRGSTISVIGRPTVRRRRGPSSMRHWTRCAAISSGHWSGPRWRGARRPTEDLHHCPWIAITTNSVWASAMVMVHRRSTRLIGWATARGIGTLMWQVSGRQHDLPK